MSSYDDQRLTALLTDAVADVEPADRLDQIRDRVAARPDHRPTWWIAGGSAALAVAATVAVVAVTSTPRPSADRGPQPIGSTSPSQGSSPSVPTPSTTGSTGPVEVAGSTVAAYYVGDGPGGRPVLYREFAAPETDGPAAALELLTSPPQDPDYRTDWPKGAFDWAKQGTDGWTVQLADASLRDRPGSMTAEEAAASVQQVVYTLQAYAQARVPVQFTFGGNPIDQVLGVPTSEPLANAPVLDTLSHVSLTTPEEGDEVSDALQVEGAANSFEANVPWVLEDASGEDVDGGSFAARGWMGEKLFSFQGSIDVSSLDPGTYTLIVMTDDASGGAEGSGPFRDSRAVVID